MEKLEILEIDKTIIRIYFTKKNIKNAKMENKKYLISFLFFF